MSPTPTSSLATLRPEIAGSLMEFATASDRMGFIGAKCFPVFNVAKKSGSFGKIPIEQLLQTRNTRRAPGGGYARSTWTFTSASYACKEHGAEEPVDDTESEMYAEYFDAEMVSAERALDAVLRNAEIRYAAAMFNATTFADQTTSVTNEWDSNHTTDADPIGDVETAVRAVWARCGLWPNAIAFNRHVFRNLRLLDQITERIEASGAGAPAKATDITPQMIAQCFDLPYVFVAGSAKNTANEGQDAAIDDIWSSEYANVFRVATRNDIREPCLGRTMHWGADGSQIGGTVESYREEQARSDIVRVRHDVDELNLHTESAQLLDNVTTI